VAPAVRHYRRVDTTTCRWLRVASLRARSRRAHRPKLEACYTPAHTRHQPMTKRLLLLILSVALSVATALGYARTIPAEQRSHSSSSRSGPTHSSSSRSRSSRASSPKAIHVRTTKSGHTPRVRSSKSSSVRSSTGRTKRSAAAKDAFERETGYPRGRKGYVVDHKIALACGGTDAPSNMQWQTIAEGKAKDKTERNGCK